MTFLYVVTDGAKVRKSGGSFVVTDPDDKKVAEIEAMHLEGAFVLNTVQVTTQALTEMLEKGVELAIISRNGKLLGQLTPPFGGNIDLRKAQYKYETDPSFALQCAKLIIAAKIANQVEVLKRWSLDNSNLQKEIGECISKMEASACRISEVQEIPSLLGFEGICARYYWTAFSTMLKADGVEFTSRQQHPSPDPVNAALSFGYAMLDNMLTSMLDAAGFDPFLGFLHAEYYNRPSLALDLMEPMRAPVVDRLVVRLFNLRIFKPQDFEPDDQGGMRMSRDALRKFFLEWEKHLGRLGIRQEIRKSVEQLRATFLSGSISFTPYRWSAR